MTSAVSVTIRATRVEGRAADVTHVMKRSLDMQKWTAPLLCIVGTGLGVLVGAALADRLHRVSGTAGATANARGDEPERHSAPPLEAAARARQAHEMGLRAHLAEPTDPQWAPGARRILIEDLSPAAASSGFELVELECRRVTCVARVRWPSLDRATGGWRELLHHPVRPVCARSVFVEDAQRPDRSIEATALFECGR
jgi:hypothetical protein